mmetsp:Transcript_89/g.201  ORF Transcript_89/g.201 Transcript_89/m.201 type:complete len:202 (+) Transcript_89:312-917(+)
MLPPGEQSCPSPFNTAPAPRARRASGSPPRKRRERSTLTSSHSARPSTPAPSSPARTPPEPNSPGLPASRPPSGPPCSCPRSRRTRLGRPRRPPGPRSTNGGSPCPRRHTLSRSLWGSLGAPTSASGAGCGVSQASLTRSLTNSPRRKSFSRRPSRSHAPTSGADTTFCASPHPSPTAGWRTPASPSSRQPSSLGTVPLLT